MPVNPAKAPPELVDKFVDAFILAGVFFLPFSKSALELTLIPAALIWLAKKIIFREKISVPAFFLVFYALFLIFCALSLLQIGPSDWQRSARGLLKWLKFVGIFFLFADRLRNSLKAKKVIAVFLFSALGAGLNGFYQMIAGQDLIKGYSVDIPGRLVRMTGSFGSPNDLAGFLLFALPLIFVSWLQTGRWNSKSALQAAGTALLGVAFILTLSRAAFFGLLLSLLLVLMVRRQYKIVFGAGLLLALFFLSSALVRENFLESLSLKDITIGERIRFWRITLGMISQSPWLGHGINTYYAKFAAFAPEESYRGYAHNCYLQMWSEIGLFGLIAFLIPLGMGLWKGMRRSMRAEENRLGQDALAVSLIAFLIQSFFDTHFYALQMAYLFWIFWGVYAGLTSAGARWPKRPSR